MAKATAAKKPSRRRTRAGRAFIFAVVGDEHVAAVTTAIAFLKKFTHAEIMVLQGRSTLRVAHDQILLVDLPKDLDDRQASIFLKTSPGVHLKGLAKCFCYLDSDVIAVRDDVDSIFERRAGPVNFALDHVDIDRFSRWAVNCGCPSGSCEHLRQAISDTFGITIASGNWPMWNGGVFLFDDASDEFLATWHDMTMRIFRDPYWKTRDQGTLAATAWKLVLQNQVPLDPKYNLIVDRMWGIPVSERARATPANFHLRDDYSLTQRPGLLAPSLLHFINGGVGQAGWKNWDDARALLDPAEATSGKRKSSRDTT
jgi:hypothetical protein